MEILPHWNPKGGELLVSNARELLARTLAVIFFFFNSGGGAGTTAREELAKVGGQESERDRERGGRRCLLRERERWGVLGFSPTSVIDGGGA